MNGSKRLVIVSVIASLTFVVLGVAFLSLSAETLDELAEHFGSSESPNWNPLFPDYEIPGLEGNVIVNIILGGVFVLLTLGATFVIGKALKKAEKK